MRFFRFLFFLLGSGFLMAPAFAQPYGLTNRPAQAFLNNVMPESAPGISEKAGRQRWPFTNLRFTNALGIAYMPNLEAGGVRAEGRFGRSPTSRRSIQKRSCWTSANQCQDGMIPDC